MRRVLPVFLVLGVACFGGFSAAEEDSAIKQIDDQIAKANIEERGLSKLSTMPAGMLNVCSKQEILDLLAFLMSGGHVPES